MLVSSTIFNLFIYLIFWFFSLPYYEQVVGSFINIVMVSIILTRFGTNITKQRLLCGEILPSVFYIIWLYFYPKQDFIYTLPLFVSFVGKIYLLTSHPSKLQVDAVEELILLQSKIQIFLIFYHPLALIYKNTPSLQVFLNGAFFLATMKLKYVIHYGTRRAYQIFHFSLDKIAKALNFRKAYQIIQSLFSPLGGHISSVKQITY